MDYSEKKLAILSALIERKGLQHVIDVGAKVLNNPVFVYDLSRKILAKSYSHLENRDIWEELFPEGRLVFDNMLMVENAGIYEQIFSDDQPVFGQFDFFSHRFLGCRVRDKSSTVGIVTIIEITPIQEEDLKLLVILCKTVLYEMLYLDRTAMQRIPYFSIFQDALEGSTSRAEIKERVSALRLELPELMRLVLIEHSEQNAGLSTHYLREFLSSSLPSSFSIVYQNAILLLIDNSQNRNTISSIVDRCFSGVPVQIGISRVFDDIMQLSHAYRQAKTANKISKRIGNDTFPCAYEDVAMYHFFEIAKTENGREDFRNPTIEFLKTYDEENNTALVETLETYLNWGGNIKKMADHMFVHKNTLYYRIQKIEELCSIDLDDKQVCFNLQFSFKFLKYLDLED